MKRLPHTHSLVSAVCASDGKTPVPASCQYLVNNSSALAKYVNVEDFATSEDPSDAKLRKAAEYHLVNIRAALARELWSRQLFVGVTALDELLFRGIVHEHWTDPVQSLLDLIRAHDLHSAGLLVFPVHSFGVLGAGMLHWSTNARIEYTASAFGLALAPQTNSLRGSIDFLNRARVALGVRRQLPVDLIEHWNRSRSTHWLTRNPLLVVRTRSFPGDYYENQFLLVSKLRASTALLSMLAAMQPAVDTRESEIWSSRTLNNFQTLDIKHYLVFFAHPNKRKHLDGNCVPMHLNPAALAEISQLGFDLNPRYWSRRRSIAAQIFQAVDRVHAGYLKYNFGSGKASSHGRMYRKMFRALTFYTRSFHRADENWLAPVSLATAFEMLLTDGYSPGVTARIKRRARLILQGSRGSRAMVRAVEDLYGHRSEIVHGGAATQKVDLDIARRAFVHSFVAMCSRLPSLSPKSSTPAKDLCGDAQG